MKKMQDKFSLCLYASLVAKIATIRGYPALQNCRKIYKRKPIRSPLSRMGGVGNFKYFGIPKCEFPTRAILECGITVAGIFMFFNRLKERTLNNNK